MTPEHCDEGVDLTFKALVEEAARRRRAFREATVPKIHIGMATCGIASGALETKSAFEEALRERQVSALIHPVGCIGHCYAEPVVVVENPGFPPILYYKVTPGKAGMIVKSFLEEGDPLFEHLLGAMVENDLIPPVSDFPRFNQEKRVVTERCGLVDPEDIYDYLAEGGYASMARALGRDPDEIIQHVTNSGLRGRGGAGFPTGKKWAIARNAEGREKIIICNADGSDDSGEQPSSGPGGNGDRCLRCRGKEGHDLRQGRIPPGCKDPDKSHSAGK
jgi:NADH-quinone oxidoreductase subunit F